MGEVAHAASPGGRLSFLRQGKPYFGQVSTRAFLPDNVNTNYLQLRARRAHFARDNILCPVLRFPNYCVDSSAGGQTWAEKGTGSTTALTAAIEYPSGVFTQVTFGGGASVVMADLSTTDSDPVPIFIPNGAQFWVRTFLQNGVSLPNAGSLGMSTVPGIPSIGDFCDTATSGLTDNTMGGGYTSSTNTQAYGPCGIFAWTEKPSILVFGDSLTFGENDTGDSSGDLGETCRAIGSKYAYMSYGIRGDDCTHWWQHSTLRRAAIPYCSHIVFQLGVNDFIHGRSAAQCSADTTSSLALITGLKPTYLTTLLPSASSTDNYATLVNQTAVSWNPGRVTENDRRRQVPPGVISVFDIASIIESSLDSGLIKAGVGYFTNSSSIHPVQAGYLAIKNSGVIQLSAFRR